MNPRTALLILAAAGLAATSAGCAGTGADDVSSETTLGEQVAATDAATATSTAPTGELTGLLYVAEAAAAEVAGSWPTVQVNLTGTDSEILWFQDRPGRDAGEMKTSELVDQWDELGFSADPPNAVIRHDGGDGLGTVVEMTDPVWDQPTGTLTFTATAADAAAEPLPWLLSDVSLFIDDGGMDFQDVRISVSNAQPGQTISLELTPTSAGDQVGFSTGRPAGDSGSISVTPQSGDLPLTDLRVSSSKIELRTSSRRGGAPLSFEVGAMIFSGSGASTFYATSSSDPGVEVTLAMGDSQPQVVDQSQTLIELRPR